MRVLQRLDGWFGVSTSGSTFGRELLAGATTFMTMCYILAVNPSILGQAGMPFEEVLAATALSSAAGTLLMGLYARYPVALAPGMGLNAYFALVVAPQLSATLGSREAGWHAALGCVLISGLLFLALAVVRAREAIINSIPSTLKLAIAAGIGLFIALIGFEHGQLIQASPATLVTVGDLRSAPAMLTIGGLVLIGALMARGIPGGMFYGILALTVAAILLGITPAPDQLLALPKLGGTWLQLDVGGALRSGVLNVIFAFFFVDLFDTVGTLVGIAEQGGFLDQQGRLPRARQALLADAVATTLGALLGTSTVTSYIESSAGIAVGGRTGLTSVVVAVLFLAALFFAPLLRAIPQLATAPVLILIGALMIANVRKIAWNDLSEALPAFIAFAGIAFTFSIAEGLALAFITYALVKALAGRHREVTPLTWVLAALFVLRYALMR